jgi:hypothetical protein
MFPLKKKTCNLGGLYVIFPLKFDRVKSTDLSK